MFATTPPTTATAPSRVLLPVLLLAVFVVPISIAGTAVALPAIAADLGSASGPLQWVVNGFNAAFALFTLVWGALGDRLGYRTTWLAGLSLTVAGSIVSALAPSLILLDAARIVAGMGAAAVFTATTSILSSVYRGGAGRARAFTLLGTILGLGLALGPTISGSLTAWLGWRGVFAAFAVAVGMSLAAARLVPRVRPEQAGSGRILDLSLLRNRRFLALSLVPVVQAVGFITMLTYLPVAFSAVYGHSSGTTGLIMLAMTVPVLALPVIGVRAVARHRHVSVGAVMVTSLVALIAGDVLLLALSPDASFLVVLGGMVLLGIGMGLPLGLIDGEALAAVPPHRAGTAAGVLNFLRLGSEAIAVGGYTALLAAVVASNVSNPDLAERIASGLPGYATEYTAAFDLVQAGVIGLTVLGTGAVALLLRGSADASDRASAETVRQADAMSPAA